LLGVRSSRHSVQRPPDAGFANLLAITLLHAKANLRAKPSLPLPSIPLPLLPFDHFSSSVKQPPQLHPWKGGCPSVLPLLELRGGATGWGEVGEWSSLVVAVAPLISPATPDSGQVWHSRWQPRPRRWTIVSTSLPTSR
jgi:hypothetical protein